MEKRKELQNNIKKIIDEFSEAFQIVDKFYRDLAKGKVSEKEFPHDYSKIVLKNQIEFGELINRLQKLDETNKIS